MATKKCGVGELTGANFRVVIHPGTSNQTDLPGVNSLKLPGMTREAVTVDDFSRDFATTIAGGGSYTPITWAANYLVGNAVHNYLTANLRNNTEFSDIWIYVDDRPESERFWALDLASDPCATMQVSSFDPQEATKNAVLSVQGSFTVNGDGRIYDKHTDTLIYEVAAGVLTAVDGQFIAKGFTEGMSIIMETGVNTSPFEYGIAESVTATTIAFVDKTIVVPSATSGRIHGSSDLVKII